MRVKNSLRNIRYNLIAQIANLLVQFISRTIFIQILGQEYLGLNGLFANILTILSLADMGIGTVLTYTMYKPLADNNKNKILQLINYYRKVYICISAIILCAGIVLIPFLPTLIKGGTSIPNQTLIYILYLINTASTYLFSYKTSIINADQKNYIVTLIQQIFNIISNLAMIIALLLTHNFIFYLATQIIFSIFTNIYLSHTAEKLYPFIKQAKNYTLPKAEKKKVQQGAAAMLLHKVGGVVVNGTDNILLSILVNLNTVGIYSNYTLIINSIKHIISIYTTSIIASVGNLNVTENIHKIYIVYKRLAYSTFVIVNVTSICLFCLLNDFIKLWVGPEYLLSSFATFIIISTFYITGLRQIPLCFIDATGLFTKNKLKPILESAINLLASVILGLKYGAIGIFLGTLISMIIICIPSESYILYKYNFKMSIKKYYTLLFKYLCITVITLSITELISRIITADTYAFFALKSLITLGVSSVLTIITTAHQGEFKYFKKMLKNTIDQNWTSSKRK